MKLKLHNGEYYLLSGDIITDKGYHFCIEDIAASHKGEIFKSCYPNGLKDIEFCECFKKIIASTDKLEDVLLIDKTQIESLLNKSDIESIADKKLKEIYPNSIITNSLREDFTGKFVLGYNQSLKDNVDKVKEAIKWIDNLIGKNASTVPDEHLQTFKNYLKSLSEKTEWDVECEMKQSNYVVSGGLIPEGEIGGKGLETHWSYEPKLNEQGFVIIKLVK